MNCFGAEIDGPMAVIRAIHFAATAMTAGALIFRAAVAEPALRATKQPATAIDAQIRRVAWIGLAVTLVSGALWLMLQSASMSGETQSRIHGWYRIEQNGLLPSLHRA